VADDPAKKDAKKPAKKDAKKQDSDTRDLVRVIVGVLLAILLLAFVFANMHSVKIGFVVTDRHPRLIFVLVITALIGALLDRLWLHHRNRSRD